MAVITVAFLTESPVHEVHGAYDLGRELIELGQHLQRESFTTVAGGGDIEGALGEVGMWKIEDEDEMAPAGSYCEAVTAGSRVDGREFAEPAIEHFKCAEFRDHVVTSIHGGRILYEPPYPSPKGRIRV